MIERILRFVLGADADSEVGEDVVATALEAFNQHSQVRYLSR